MATIIKMPPIHNKNNSINKRKKSGDKKLSVEEFKEVQKKIIEAIY